MNKQYFPIMKRIVFLVVFSFMFLTTTFAQDPQEKKSSSKTVEFLSKHGTFMKKEFYDLPSIGSSKNKIDCQVLIITDLKNNEKVGCLRLTTYCNLSDINDICIGVLDSDELDACILCFDKIVSEIAIMPAATNTDIEYQTRDGVKLGIFWNVKKSEWKTLVQTNSKDSRSIASLSIGNIRPLISIFKQAKQMIIEKTEN